MTATTTTPALASGGGSASLAVTSAAVNLGTASLPVYAATGAPDGSKPGAFVYASPDFVGLWRLDAHGSGARAAARGDGTTIAARGDNVLFATAGAGPIASLTGLDALTLYVSALAGGSVALAVVQ